MSSPARSAANARTAAVADLFDALEGLLIVYNAMPDEDRARRWSGDADRITGEIARHLGTARSRLSSTFAPPVCPKVEVEERTQPSG